MTKHLVKMEQKSQMNKSRVEEQLASLKPRRDANVGPGSYDIKD